MDEPQLGCIVIKNSPCESHLNILIFAHTYCIYNYLCTQHVISTYVIAWVCRAVGVATAAFVVAVLEGSTQPGVWFPEEVYLSLYIYIYI